jgi:hypothetical protein
VRRNQKVKEFDSERGGVFRIALGCAGREIVLGEGAHIAPGDAIIALHL